VVPHVGGAKIGEGTLLEADQLLAGAPSIFFDAIAMFRIHFPPAESGRSFRFLSGGAPSAAATYFEIPCRWATETTVAYVLYFEILAAAGATNLLLVSR
jgi:hypothetical protein